MADPIKMSPGSDFAQVLLSNSCPTHDTFKSLHRKYQAETSNGKDMSTLLFTQDVNASLEQATPSLKTNATNLITALEIPDADAASRAWSRLAKTCKPVTGAKAPRISPEATKWRNALMERCGVLKPEDCTQLSNDALTQLLNSDPKCVHVLVSDVLVSNASGVQMKLKYEQVCIIAAALGREAGENRSVRRQALQTSDAPAAVSLRNLSVAAGASDALSADMWNAFAAGADVTRMIIVTLNGPGTPSKELHEFATALATKANDLESDDQLDALAEKADVLTKLPHLRAVIREGKGEWSVVNADAINYRRNLLMALDTIK
jgi:hypothetical protein